MIKCSMKKNNIDISKVKICIGYKAENLLIKKLVLEKVFV
jgi:hypothetical protein